MSRYVVTGCAGFIGSHLAELLIAQGHTVVGVDSFLDNYPRVWKDHNLASLVSDPSFSLVERDIADGIVDEVASSDGVFHLAAQPGVRESWGPLFTSYVRNNILATQRVLDAAKETSRRVVFSSSSSIYGNAGPEPSRESDEPRPISPYGVTKLSCEHLVRAYSAAGVDAVMLRYFTVYGPRQRPDMAITKMLLAALRDEEFEVYGDGRQTRDFTFVADAVDATARAMSGGTPGAVYNVGGGSTTSVAEVLATIESLSGRPLRIRHTPAALGDPRQTSSDTTALRTELGWKPSTTIPEGIRAQYEWAVERVGAGA